ncbi:LacI family DNA-binding transcriptional regulator [Fusibacter ferrireducens]|nr:LacI family DNA-binding transcriptional regulator [Fusibacter ferrireducens]
MPTKGFSHKKPTIKDIAKLVGVSHVAVSKALKDAPDISSALKEKVNRVASEIGYMPNASASYLSSKNTAHNIGMIVPSLGADTAYDEAFKAISEAAAFKNHSILLGVSDRNRDLERQYCRIMCENRVGALIISPISSEIEDIKQICAQTVPLIFIGGKVDSKEQHCVHLNYSKSAALAVDYLYALGHRDIFLFLYHPMNKTIMQKKEGYEKAMRARNLTPTVYLEGESADTYTAGCVLTESLIKSGNLPTAIWCASDLMAIGVMDTLKLNHFKIPEDISVMGHDNLPFSKFSAYQLTTFDVPKKALGEAAVNMALTIMENGDDEERIHVSLEALLIKRGSTGKAPVKIRDKGNEI